MSAIVRLTPHRELPIVADNVDTLQRVLREAFNQRRKTLRNNLKNLLSGEQIETLGIDPGIRPEQLGLTEFVTIANFLERQAR
jgi:16S rRNA (adenine1518-N6/adenine1519-N6)-dimethyltransferase